MTTALGIDIGGTFTDVVLIGQADGGRTGDIHTAKVLTTPDDPATGVLDGVAEVLATAGRAPAEVSRAVHATTLAANLILERKGGPVAYVTTAGFGDILVIGNERKGDAQKYDLFYTKQDPIVPRYRTVEVTERMAADGSVVTPLDETQARTALAALLEREPTAAIAVCFLHAYANDHHERQVADLVAELDPARYVALSSEVWPEYRELPRACTTVMSAYVGPTISGYITALEAGLATQGVGSGLQIMGSSGGILSSATVAKRPVQLVESGPAAGVMAAAHIGRISGIHNLISFDMGGTTAKAGVVRNGEVAIAHEFYVGGPASAGMKQINTGYPLQIPVIDLAEVGAGGGSVARVDEGGALRVGPDSAGAVPGPACYGRGGTQPTVTDADLVLGYLNPDYFLGGRMPIDRARAEAALAGLAEAMGRSVTAAAAGIHEVANATMAGAIRVVTLERGIDPREFTLVASGGAAGCHVASLAEEFGIPTVVVPAHPGVGSALGLLAADVVTDHVRTRVIPATDADPEAVEALYGEMEDDAAAEIGAEGFDLDHVVIQREIDVRYRHQAHELTVPLTGNDLAEAAAAFGRRYRELYGIASGDPVEFVNYRVRVIATVPKPDWPTTEVAAAPPPVHSRRRAYFNAGPVDTPVHRRVDLRPGHRINGPAIIEEPSSTTVVPPTWCGTVDRHLSLQLSAAVNAGGASVSSAEVTTTPSS
ncbi:hydantoinase/oxoprolinase family protein [Candidatus Poriferisocius sp.]|uniref:hydantoinase/oxoprolinase family protein n=1 Tax=Candidatus Poriferisocius sp. TaxID=3101276 RepID=UPI003B5C8B80